MTASPPPLPRPLSGRPLIAVSLRDADTGAVLAGEDADTVYDTAAIGRLVLLCEAAVRLADGRLSREAMISRSPQDMVPGPGLWQHLRAAELPATDVITLVAAAGDTVATNALLERIGLTSVTERGQMIGLRRTALLDRIRPARRPTDPPAVSVGTAGELAGLMVALHQGQVRSRAVSRQVLDWLALCADTSLVAGALGVDPWAHTDPDRGITLAHATAADVGVRVETGLASGGGATMAYAAVAAFADADRDTVLGELFRVGQRVRRFVGGAHGV